MIDAIVIGSGPNGLSAAIVLEMDKQICRSARVVLGGVAPIPWRLPQVEQLLAGQRITDALAAKAAEIALEGAKPLAKNAYKVPLTKGVVRRTLLEVAARGCTGSENVKGRDVQ